MYYIFNVVIKINYVNLWSCNKFSEEFHSNVDLFYSQLGTKNAFKFLNDSRETFSRMQKRGLDGGN